jgi:hypothetical protein
MEEAVRRVREGESLKDISEEYSIPRTTLHDRFLLFFFFPINMDWGWDLA